MRYCIYRHNQPFHTSSVAALSDDDFDLFRKTRDVNDFEEISEQRYMDICKLDNMPFGLYPYVVVIGGVSFSSVVFSYNALKNIVGGVSRETKNS